MGQVKFNLTIDYEVSEQIVALQTLMKTGADVTAENNCAIINAAENNHTETLKILVNAIK